MASTESCVTIHMVASLDRFIARKDGRVDWLETSDNFEGGNTLDPEFVQEFVKDGRVLFWRSHSTGSTRMSLCTSWRSILGARPQNAGR